MLRREPDTEGTSEHVPRGRRRRDTNRVPIFSLLVLAAFAFCGLFGRMLAPHDPSAISLRDSLRPPVFAGGSMRNPLGTDQTGRDILSRVLAGSQVSFRVAVAAVILAGFIGFVVALAAGYSGRRVDAVLTRVADASMAFPVLLLAIVMAAIYGQGLWLVVLVLVLAGWPQYARVLRSEVLRIKTMDYVVMSRVMGARPIRVIIAHVIPNVVPTLLVLATLQIGLAIIAEGSLSFLGIGVPAPAPSWGNMLSEGRGYLETAWWIPIVPGICLSLTVLAANLTGDWLRQVLDPVTRR